MDGGRPLDGVRVLIVEDQYYIATELRALVAGLGGLVVGPAKDVEGALALMDLGRPDIAILDVNLDGGRVYPVAEALEAAGKPYVFVTGYEAWALDPRFERAPRLEKPVAAVGLAAALMRGLETVSREGVSS